jgi:hypothetical protein
MGRIDEDYATDATVAGADKVIGTDAADGSTKNYTIDGIKTYALTGGVSGTFASPTSITVVNGIITAIS